MIDRRKNPREFLVSGWDPYVVELTAENRDSNTKRTVAEEAPARKPVITRWRVMVMQRIGLS